MNSKVKEKVAKKFENQEKISSFLQLQNDLEEVKYDYNDNRLKGTRRVKREDLEKYWFENYKNKLPSEFENMSFKSFKQKMVKTRESRYRAGVIAETEGKQLLAIKIKDNKSNINQLDFPKGKEDCSDKKFMKATAFREFSEETGVWVSDDDYKECKTFVDINKSASETIRYYLLNKLVKDSVNLNHEVKDEVYGLKWVTRNFDKSASEFTTTKMFDRALERLKKFVSRRETDTSIGLKEYKLARKKHLEKQKKLAKDKTNKDNVK